jgi:hypothetical protein
MRTVKNGNRRKNGDYRGFRPTGAAEAAAIPYRDYYAEFCHPIRKDL